MITDHKSLLEFLPEQRWFGYKDSALAGIELVDEVILSDGPPSLVIALVAVSFEGTVLHYQLPLVVDDNGVGRDATDEPTHLKLIGELMAHGDSVKGTHGVFHFGGPGLDPMADPPGSRSVRVVGAEQSNTSIVLDEQVIVKLFRRLDVGPNPDLELNRLLTSEGFDHVPAQVGEITYEGTIEGEDVEMDLAIAQQFLPDGLDGWEHVREQIQKLYDEVDPADTAEDHRFLTEERAHDLLQSLTDLGDVIASMHVTLAREEPLPDLMPEPIDDDEVAALKARIMTSLDSSDEVSELRPKIERSLGALDDLEDLGAKTRVHGDLHLGQVLLTPRGWMVLDFEGEPLRPLEERRAKFSPLKDVAGMLRSFNYAAVAALFMRADPESDAWARLEPWARCWEQLAREHFLSGYLTRAHEGRFLPADREGLTILLQAFEIEKALYELAYEKGHRPDWVRIPLHGLARILEIGT